jgi:hypothetical protein
MREWLYIVVAGSYSFFAFQCASASTNISQARTAPDHDGQCGKVDPDHLPIGSPVTSANVVARWDRPMMMIQVRRKRVADISSSLARAI